MARKENVVQGYHCAALAMPVASWKIAAATSTPIETRSAACSASGHRSRGGRAKSRGKTDQSLTSSSGTHA